jgi:scyllo-inositol 2-dehydrogenase (NADP+)
VAKPRAIKTAVIGYGGAFGMGKRHLAYAQETPGLTPAAACDVDPARTRAAAEDFPGIQTFNTAADLLAHSECELVTVITPHNSHAELAIRCLQAGRHVIVEKPMCITVEEADAMMAAAKRHKRMLTVYHNRRLDGDYLALKEIVKKGLVGRIFHIEGTMSGFNRPRNWWRSDKKISGGGFYDWGAHIVDWVLGLTPAKVERVIGFHKHLVWTQFTNEDHSHAVIRFKDGTVADIQRSGISAIPRPRWRVLGTKGGITVAADHDQAFEVRTQVKGYPATVRVPFAKPQWEAYYRNIADHLHRGKKLLVPPEEARRVIGVIEAADVSSQEGSQPVAVPHE